MSIKKTLAYSMAIPAILLSASALAQDDIRNVDKSGPFFGETATGHWLVGLKYGKMQHDADGFSSGNNTGFMLGYEFSRPVFYGHAAIEFEYLTSSSAGDFRGQASPVDPSNPTGEGPVGPIGDGSTDEDGNLIENEFPPKYPGDGEWENEVKSIYAVYRGPGTLYFKAKGGLTASKFEAFFNDPNILVDDIREDKTTIGWGIGLGVHAGKYIDVELEYAGNQGNSDLNFLALAGNVRF